MKSIHVLRKPCSEPTVAANVLKHGTGGINVDGSRVGTEATVTVRNGNSGAHGRYGVDTRVFRRENPPGRWPANLVLGACVDSELDEVFPNTVSSPVRTTKAGQQGTGTSFSMTHREERTIRYADDAGSAARYFKRVGE